MKRYEVINHTADLAIHAYGETLPQLFENLAIGMLESIADLEKIDEKVKIDIEVEGETLEDLLVAWLGELIFRHEVDEILFKRVEIIRFDNTSLHGAAYGEMVDSQKHVIYTEIKNATYHQLKVERLDDGNWETTVIFDI